jgi:polysaccharide export outer membrane protein
VIPIPSRGAQAILLAALLATLAACGLPRAGPDKGEIFAGAVQNQGDVFVVAVSDRVARATAVVPALGFSDALRSGGRLGADTIRSGDALSLSVYENVSEGLLVGAGQNVARLDEVQVDDQGFIFVPYAGRVRAAGLTPDELREEITTRLGTQTPDPQVAVRRVAGDGATVSVMGSVGSAGVYAIERPTRTLAAMLAQAGGVTSPPEVTQVQVMRDAHSGRIWLTDLYENPHLDIALRNGDRILVKEDSRAYTILGATGAQSRVTFRTHTLSALEALAQVGGLNSNLADPTGVFVLRNEPAAIAHQVLGRTDLVGDQRIAYVLDLTAPTGMFLARDFVIRDGDTVYVTEAPFVQWQKTLSAITGSFAPAGTAASLANSF